MGGGASRNETDDSSIGATNPDGKNVKFDNKTAHVVNKMGLKKKQAVELYDVYYRVREPVDGLVYRRQFHALLKIPPSTFSELLFTRFATRKDESMSLEEFLCSLWSFLSFHHHMMGAYLFFLFDQPNTGTLSLDVARSMLGLVRTMHFDHCQPSEKDKLNYDRDIQNLLNSNELRKQNCLTVTKFVYWSQAHLNLFKAFEVIHESCRKAVISEKFWETQQQQRAKRSEMSNADYMLIVLRVRQRKKDEHKASSKKGMKTIEVAPVHPPGTHKSIHEHTQRSSERNTYTSTSTTTSSDSGGRRTPPRPKSDDVSDDVRKRKKKNKSLEQVERVGRSRMQQARRLARTTSKVVASIIDNFANANPAGVTIIYSDPNTHSHGDREQREEPPPPPKETTEVMSFF
eukprot:CAMPEP_0114430992 /NCGR_PEP_ID=MMETSP0103-20121206/10351_1 /TAXON_ID=37642 ORGANISM="Paraphysomonas imperforata, Strain PA2" /NCGR_SAMPLE_ID=MMETSP0103 /ASSEMBLY_ACC=CAM_ASM_000201 /LENGTH=401 /DNA_ID=CAMNT_0001600505 /DNA_START=151 /DNA_END=1356 /DNA_ORIENTATION=-